MRDISLHLLDLVQNSVSAEAKNISIAMQMDEAGWLKVFITDDGHGMDPENQRRAINPFYTTRKTRKVGLGIPLAVANARQTGGDVEIRSMSGQGTALTAIFNTRHIDCPPLGDIAGSIVSLIIAYPDTPEFLLSCSSPTGSVSFSTTEAKKILEGVSLSEPEVISWIDGSIRNEMMNVFGGALQ